MDDKTPEPPRLGLQSLSSCAQALDLSLAHLMRLADRAPSYYRPFSLPKGNGFVRTIDNPVGLLRRVQGLVHRRLLAPHLKSAISFGGIKGCSHFDAAAEHVRKPAVGKIDIKQFFPHISIYHVYDLFISMGCSPDVSRLLTRLLTVNGHIPQGAPASTAIANLVLWSFDAELQQRAARSGTHVSRFVDDINVSGHAQPVRSDIDWIIRRLNRQHFPVNRRKTGVVSARKPQVVTGLTVNHRLAVPKTYRKRIRDQVRRAHRFGITEKEGRSLVGKINYVARSNRPAAERLRDELSKAPQSPSVTADPRHEEIHQGGDTVYQNAKCSSTTRS